MRISDWSSDVCSSDLVVIGRGAAGAPVHEVAERRIARHGRGRLRGGRNDPAVLAARHCRSGGQRLVGVGGVAAAVKSEQRLGAGILELEADIALAQRRKSEEHTV